MIKLKYIYQGWKNWLLDKFSDLKYKSYFDKRLQICQKCEKNDSGVCDICKCVLVAKTKSEDSACPLKKWDTIKNTLEKEGN